jgi:hypothetical protein
MRTWCGLSLPRGIVPCYDCPQGLLLDTVDVSFPHMVIRAAGVLRSGLRVKATHVISGIGSDGTRCT